MIQQKELNAISVQAGVRDTQVERDYVISWVLYGISKNIFLKEHLVFKGGGVLRKVYFPAYRFSETLGFTFSGEMDIPSLRAAFLEMASQVCAVSGIMLSLKDENKYGNGSFNFQLTYSGPLGGSGKFIKVDIRKDELMYNRPEEREIVNTYSDLVSEKYTLLCYTLEEIAAEKMCSLMQRTAPEDLYDIWYLFEMSGNPVEDCVFAFQEKARDKKMDPALLVKTIVGKEPTLAKHWKEHLAHQIKTLPEFRKVWRELEKSWRKYQRFIEK